MKITRTPRSNTLYHKLLRGRRGRLFTALLLLYAAQCLLDVIFTPAGGDLDLEARHHLSSFASSDEKGIVIDEVDLTKQKTGSFSNCDANNIVTSFEVIYSTGTEAKIIVSCNSVRFRVSFESLQKTAEKAIIVGVLSEASIEGRQRRTSIRETWANGNQNVYFIVAGPWGQVKDEYNSHGDLFWIDEDEVYNGEQSVLTTKTLTFISAIAAISKKLQVDYTHIFKTDDDTYVNLNLLREELTVEKQYVGHCQLDYTKVKRDNSYKWPLSIKTYPEEYFPRYCQGAGYALSRDFAECAAFKNHVANTRFIPFEDVAVGILAERCSIEPSEAVKGEVKLGRLDSMEAKKRVQLNDKRTDNLIPPGACMDGRILQHRVIDDHDMQELHKTVLDPEHCKVTKMLRIRKVARFREEGLEWFG